MLERLHAAHSGIRRTMNRARLTIYWPNMDEDVATMTEECRLCQERLPSNPNEPLIIRPRPERPFQEIAADFAFYGGRKFLVIVDRMTDWIEIIDMGRDTTAAKIVMVTRTLFARTAVPDVFYSDGERNFDSKEFRGFLKDFGVKFVTSSPTHSRSNGKAESAVKVAKKIIAGAWRGNRMDEKRFALALLQHRNTPTSDGRSPAQKLFGRPIQDTLPAHRRSFDPAWQRSDEDARKQRERYIAETTRRHDQHAQELDELGVGTHVAVQDSTSKEFTIHGVVVECRRRRYWIRTESNRILVRNRKYLRRRRAIAAGGGGRRRGDAENADSAPTLEQQANAAMPSEPGANAGPPQAIETGAVGTSHTRRSERASKPPKRLQDEPYWPK